MTPLDHWLLTQPVAIRTLAREFPFGSEVERDGHALFVVGWADGRELIVSAVRPRDWLDAPVGSRMWVRAKKLRRVEA